MISRDLAKELTRKFAAKRGFPKSSTPEGKAALVSLFDTFQRYAANEQHARAMAEDLTVDTEWSPTPSEIYRVALATAPERKANPCPVCHGTGFIEKTAARKKIPGMEHSSQASGVAPCECRTGGGKS